MKNYIQEQLERIINEYHYNMTNATNEKNWTEANNKRQKTVNTLNYFLKLQK